MAAEIDRKCYKYSIFLIKKKNKGTIGFKTFIFRIQ